MGDGGGDSEGWQTHTSRNSCRVTTSSSSESSSDFIEGTGEDAREDVGELPRDMPPPEPRSSCSAAEGEAIMSKSELRGLWLDGGTALHAFKSKSKRIQRRAADLFGCG